MKKETELEAMLPADIERMSFEIITRELGNRTFPPDQEPIVKRVIHTTADFDYADSLAFSEGAVGEALKALREGAPIIMDTNMGKSGVNRGGLKKAGSQIYCFMADGDVAEAAARNRTTRAVAGVDKAAGLGLNGIFAVGNAPTALVRICRLVEEGRLKPRLIIGVPVGFVNVVSAKEQVMTLNVPYIVARGRKGGSNVAAAICNALLYQL